MPGTPALYANHTVTITELEPDEFVEVVECLAIELDGATVDKQAQHLAFALRDVSGRVAHEGSGERDDAVSTLLHHAHDLLVKEASRIAPSDGLPHSGVVAKPWLPAVLGGPASVPSEPPPGASSAEYDVFDEDTADVTAVTRAGVSVFADYDDDEDEVTQASPSSRRHGLRLR